MADADEPLAIWEHHHAAIPAAMKTTKAEAPLGHLFLDRRPRF